MVTLSEMKTWALPQIVVSYVFIVSGLVVNFLQFLTFIFVWPFDRLLYRRLNYYIAYSFWAFLTSLVHWWSASDFDIYIKEEDLKMLGHENAISIMNHKYDIDWLMGWTLCQRVGLLGGAKAFFKASIRLIPIIGWSWWLSEQIFVKRVWENDSKSLVEYFNNIFNFPKDLHYNVVILCEGTRFTEEKHQASVEFAKAKGLPVLKHHLTPRTKGFNLLAKNCSGKIEYVYDITLAIDDVNGEKPRLKHITNGVPLRYQFFIRRIPISEMNVDDEAKCAQYLYNLYKEKDEIFDSYVKNGDFSQLGVAKHRIPKNYYDLCVLIGWTVLITIPSTYFLVSFLITGSWFARFVFVALAVTVKLTIKWFLYKTDSKRTGSKFGLKTQ